MRTTHRTVHRTVLVSAAALLLGSAALVGCPTSSGGTATDPATGSPPAAQDDADERAAEVLDYRIVETYPHDTKAYTQGLLWDDGHLIESTGRPGQSTIRRVDLETGKVVRSTRLPGSLFGEGVTRWKGFYIQLTWKTGQAIYRDARTLNEVYRIDYPGEGWGLTLADDVLVMSNGSSELQLRDPKTFELQERVQVTIWDVRRERYVPLDQLNELEWIDGEVWANVYQDESIVRIDLETGRVTALIDFRGLQAKQKVKDPSQDVQNGIAYDPETGRIFITGKYWPNLYEIEVVEGE